MPTMNKDWLPYIGGVVLAIITYWFGKKKMKVDVQKTELESVEKAVKIWRELAEDMKQDMDKWKSAAIRMEEEMVKWKDIAVKLEFDVAALKKEVDRLKGIINGKGKYL